MSAAEGVSVTLAAGEPNVRQPVAIDFDDRGRLWVVQYLQYPNPAGLKRVKVDRYSRTVYDRVPKPPPHGPRGADRITILEDNNGDGVFESAKDFIDGLNLTTGFALGHGGVFVLNVPYLLYYPDKNRDDIPDADPEVLLSGFGMEDTSSLANSLTWGPDGWLYGTQGTNITANIRGIEFEQGVWRYHPRTKDFELFCEGGGNSWGLDFDRHGNLLYSTNHGGYLMHHGMQGAYYAKSFQKHGELHNPYAFGYFDHVPHKGFQGGHVTVGGFVYQADSLPRQYRGKYIGADLLGHGVNWHPIFPVGSTFRTEHGGSLAEANDTWFAPSDVTLGPDGAVFVADWHDKRTAHPDPDADWDRSNGRVFRIQATGHRQSEHVDPNSLSSSKLVDWLGKPNIWHVRRAHRILAERRDATIIPRLQKAALGQESSVPALWGLWTLYVSGGFDEPIAARLLTHTEPSIRSWTVRLLGDEPSVAQSLVSKLQTMAEADPSPVVCSQLACTAARLPANASLLVVRGLAGRDELMSDPYIPLLCWWSLEKHAMQEPDQVLKLFAAADAWKRPLIKNTLLGRLMRRYCASGEAAGFRAAALLLASAPNAKARRFMREELDAGLALINRPRQSGLPLGTAFSKIAVKQAQSTSSQKRFKTVPSQFRALLTDLAAEKSNNPLVLKIATRLGSQPAYQRVLDLAASEQVEQSTRLAMLDIIDDLGDANAVTVLLPLIGSGASELLQAKVLRVLAGFRAERIAKRVLDVYPELSGELKTEARGLLLGRAEWAFLLLDEVDRGTYSPKEISVEELRRVALHEDDRLDALMKKHWGQIRAGTPEEKLAEIRRLNNDLRAFSGDAAAGHLLYKKHCANCHQLFSEGKKLGPELTNANRKDREYLLVSLVDPSAQVRKEFLSYVVVTTNGQVLEGLLAEETPAQVTLVNAKNERRTVSRADIEIIKGSSASLMPEKLLKQLNPQQVRDLFAYLQK